jgi:hypothetical protein
LLIARRLQAPQQDGAVLAEPPLSALGETLRANRQLLAELGTGPFGRPWADLRAEARRSAVAAAVDYLAESGEPVPSVDSSSLIVAGHQPELFHPGVWLKNFALCRLAQLHGTTPLNLVVDNDTVKPALLRLPALEKEGARLVTVPFDHWGDEVPYEERTVRDENLFATLPERAAEYTANWNLEPLLPEFWSEVCRQARRTKLLGERFAAARRTFERRWGCHSLELPVSRLCQTESFAWFACHVVSNATEFHRIYNESVHEYRRSYGLRSRNHPVPDLASDGDWLELPFWGWRHEKPRRGRVMVRPGRDRVELRVGAESWPGLPAAADPLQIVHAWRWLEQRGFKVRSRALTNTLYARVFLGDLFTHGIGGGKYDEVTDQIIRRFYGFEPPEFAVLSGTLRLPLKTFPADVEDRRRIAHALHDVRCNPQRHLENHACADPAPAELARRKAEWIEREPEDARGRRERFHVLKELTRTLEPYVSEQEARLRRQLEMTGRELEANAVLKRRDYAFCLFPEVPLRRFLTSALPAEALQSSAGS